MPKISDTASNELAKNKMSQVSIWAKNVTFAINDLDAVLDDVSKSFLSDGTADLRIGDLIFINSNGVCVKAKSNSNDLYACGIVTNKSGSKVSTRLNETNISVKTEGIGDIQYGDKLFLSSNQSGACTNTAPTVSGGIIQFVGIAKANESGGMIKADISINLDYTEI